MPRYFFHTSGSEPFSDLEGAELPNLDAVGAQAVTSLAELLRDQGGEFCKMGKLRMLVTNEVGQTLIILEVFAEAVHSCSRVGAVSPMTKSLP